MKKTNQLIGSIIVGIVILMGLFTWVLLGEAQLSSNDFDSFGPYGFKAINLLLQKQGYQTQIVNGCDRPITDLIIVITSTPITSDQLTAISGWIKQGGTVLELAEKPLIYPKEIGNINFELDQPLAKVNSADPIDPIYQGLIYHFYHNTIITIANPTRGFYAVKGHYFIYQQNYGQGSIINWNDPGSLYNIQLRQYPDNAVILATLINQIQKSKQIDFWNFTPLVKPQPLKNRNTTREYRYLTAICLFILAISLMLWKISARFGRPRPLILAKGRVAGEFVYSMAALCQQANARLLVLENLYQSLLDKIAQITNSSGDKELTDLSERLSSIFGPGEQVQKILVVLEWGKTLNESELSRAQFLEYAIKLDTYRRELEQWQQFKN